MKLEKAIEVLEKAQEATAFVGEHPLRKAQQLGIEALKQVQKFQRMGSKISPLILPGETK